MIISRHHCLRQLYDLVACLLTPGAMRSYTEIPKQPTLTDRKAALEAKLAELSAIFVDRSELAVQNSADPIDTIRIEADRDVLVQQMNMSARTLGDIRDAIESIDHGCYGICEECEEPIAARRLDAIPWARLCVRCQQERDRSDSRADDFSAAA